MRCDRVSELILTDYSDGQLSSQWAKEIEVHIEGCQACAALYKQVQSSLIKPFQQATRLEVDESLWQRIKSKVEPVPIVQPLEQESVWDKIRHLVYQFRPALVGICIGLIIGMVLLKQIPKSTVMVAKTEHQVKEETYLTALMDADTLPSDGLTSRVEQYFL